MFYFIFFIETVYTPWFEITIYVVKLGSLIYVRLFLFHLKQSGNYDLYVCPFKKNTSNIKYQLESKVLFK